MISTNVKLRHKGQLTLPKEVRDELGVEEGEAFSVAVIDGEIRMIPIRGVAARTFGMFNHLVDHARDRSIDDILQDEKKAAAAGWVAGYLMQDAGDE